MGTHTYLRLVTDKGDSPCSAAPDEAVSDEVVSDESVGLMIDCDMCVMQYTETCDDCVVSYLVGHKAGTPVVLDFEERRAYELLNEAGLVPSSRFVSRSDAI